MQRLKVLLSAYACEPGKGSEPAVGWNMAWEVANYHEVWVLTRSNNRPAIEAELSRNPKPGLHFVYHDLPRWARWWKRGGRGMQLYYYLWQLGAYRVASKLHREIGLDLAHHVTFVNYWRPTLMALLPVPFVWGPVGGGESAPKRFWGDFSFYGTTWEVARDLARWLGEHDPFVRAAARRCVLGLAATEETAARLRTLGAKDVRVLTQVGLGKKEIERMNRHKVDEGGALRFVSLGRLLHLKGFNLGLHAFAQADLPDAQYWVIGDGPERKRLEALAGELGIADRVKFWGKLQREDALRKLGECHVLVHPSLHESGGWVGLEAMALGRPVVCLNLGGSALQVTEETGFKIPANEPKQAISELAAAMRLLSKDRGLLIRMGKAGQRRVAKNFNWHRKGCEIAELYREVRAQ